MPRPIKEIKDKYEHPVKSYVQGDTKQIIEDISKDKGYSIATVVRKLLELGIDAYLHGKNYNRKLSI